jgi:hypothetical protein
LESLAVDWASLVPAIDDCCDSLRVLYLLRVAAWVQCCFDLGQHSDRFRFRDRFDPYRDGSASTLHRWATGLLGQ